MVEAYVNRGYTLNDMQDAQQASQDFHTALKLSAEQWHRASRPGIQRPAATPCRRKPGAGARSAEVDGRIRRDASGLATAYRQQHLLGSAEQEYRAAFKYAPNDLALHLALADTLVRHAPLSAVD